MRQASAEPQRAPADALQCSPQSDSAPLPVFWTGQASRAARMIKRFPVLFALARERPAWVLMFTLGRLMPVRRALWYLGRPRSLPNQANSSLFPIIDAEKVVEALRHLGLYLGIQLPAELVREISEFAEQTPCYGDSRRTLAFLPGDYELVQAKHSAKVLLGRFFDGVEACPA